MINLSKILHIKVHTLWRKNSTIIIFMKKKSKRKKNTSGPRYWNVPVLVNTGTFLVYQSGLISKVVKTYFDRKAVKTRLKPVKTGLNRSKRGQNLNSGTRAKDCERILLGGFIFAPICMACVFEMLKT